MNKMGVARKIKRMYRVFKNMPNKKGVLLKAAKIIKVQGVSGIKTAIKNAEKKQENTEDLYVMEQWEETKKVVSRESFLFIIYSLENNINAESTYESIKQQMCKQDRVIIIREGERQEWEEKYDALILRSANKWKLILDEISKSGCDFVYFVKGGDYVPPNMRWRFSEKIQDGHKLIYSDEAYWNNELGKIDCYNLKPDFSEFEFYQNICLARSVLMDVSCVRKLEINEDVCIDFDVLHTKMMFELINQGIIPVHLEKILLVINPVTKCNNISILIDVIKDGVRKWNDNVNVVYKENRAILSPFAYNGLISICVIETEQNTIKDCIQRIKEKTKYVNYEIIEVKYNMKKSFAERCNYAEKKANGNIVVFLEDSVWVNEEKWLLEITSYFSIKNVGAVSPKIIREDQTIRYAGMISGGFGFTAIPFNGEKNDKEKGKNEIAFLNRTTSVVSATCFAVRKELFDACGGFSSEMFSKKFCNAQLSYEIKEKGYECIFCADAELTSKSDKWYDSWYDEENPQAFMNLLKSYGEALSYDQSFTENMKKVYLRGVPVSFKINQKKSKEKKNVLMISHDSLLGGATIAFQGVAKVLKKNGFDVTWLFLENGPMAAELSKDGISYIIDPTFTGNDSWLKYSKSFDIIMCNTVLLWRQVDIALKEKKKVIWWIHEAEDYYLKNNISLKYYNEESKLTVWCVGKLAQARFEKYLPKIHTNILLYGMKDYAKEQCDENTLIENNEGKKILLSIGTIEKRKGQDILIDAIDLLEKETLQQLKIVFVGKDVEEDVYSKIENAKLKYPNSIEYLGTVNREEIMRLYRQSSVVLCSSREDPMPVFMTEAMMQSKIVICSANTGTAGILKDGINGFIYCDNDEKQLANKISYVINEFDDYEEMQEQARLTYENNFAMDVFENNLMKMFNQALEEKKNEIF